MGQWKDGIIRMESWKAEMNGSSGQHEKVSVSYRNPEEEEDETVE